MQIKGRLAEAQSSNLDKENRATDKTELRLVASATKAWRRWAV